jgi:hypothetical protein
MTPAQKHIVGNPQILRGLIEEVVERRSIREKLIP